MEKENGKNTISSQKNPKKIKSHKIKLRNTQLSDYESIKEIIADDINNYKGYGYIEKSSQAIKHNDKAQAVNSIKKFAKQRSDRLSYIANSIKNLSDIIMSVQKTKVKHG
jgi:hypothetical protein